ncbi:MAG: hypothetical protein FJX37_00640 [Alphaproteobacteria bacterium]|nr:hypothetical protein [Alphaproteobacteria bacterium]
MSYRNQTNHGPRDKRGPWFGYAVVPFCLAVIGFVLWMRAASCQKQEQQRLLHPVQPVSARAKVAPVFPSLDGAHKRGGDSPSREGAVVESEFWDVLAREVDPARKEESIGSWIAGMGGAEIRGVLDRLQWVEGELGIELRARLVRRWAGIDVKAANEWTMELPSGSHRQSAIEQIALAWAETEWAEGMAWARQLPDETERSEALLAIAGEVLRTEPVEAIRMAAELPPSPHRDQLLSRAAMEWASEDASSAAEWANQIEEDALHLQTLSGVALAWAEQDVPAAMKLALNNLPSGRVQADTLVGIAGRWVQKEPEAATAWVAELPEGDLKRDATESVTAIRALQEADVDRDPKAQPDEDIPSSL